MAFQNRCVQIKYSYKYFVTTFRRTIKPIKSIYNRNALQKLYYCTQDIRSYACLGSKDSRRPRTETLRPWLWLLQPACPVPGQMSLLFNTTHEWCLGWQAAVHKVLHTGTEHRVQHKPEHLQHRQFEFLVGMHHCMDHVYACSRVGAA